MAVTLPVVETRLRPLPPASSSLGYSAAIAAAAFPPALGSLRVLVEVRTQRNSSDDATRTNITHPARPHRACSSRLARHRASSEDVIAKERSLLPAAARERLARARDRSFLSSRSLMASPETRARATILFHTRPVDGDVKKYAAKRARCVLLFQTRGRSTNGVVACKDRLLLQPR